MDYKEFMDKLKHQNERGQYTVYVPQRADAESALAGAFLNKIYASENMLYDDLGLPNEDIRIKTYHEPRMYVGETEQSFNDRLIEFEKKMNERRETSIVLGSEGNITPSEMFEMFKDTVLADVPIFLKEQFIEPIEADTSLDHDSKTPVSQVIDSLNNTRKEMIGSRQDWNFRNATNIMEQMIEARSMEEDPIRTDFTALYAENTVEEEINANRNEIYTEVIDMGDTLALAIPGDRAKSMFDKDVYDLTENDNIIVAMISKEEAEDIGIAEKIAPVLDDGGQQIYNSEGDNITLTIHSITDAWAKSQINDAIQNTKPMERNGVSFKILSLDKVGGFYEDIAKSAEGTDVVGYTYPLRDRVVFKPIHQENGFNIEIPEKWKEGDFPGQVEQCNKNGLSVSFRSQESFLQGIDIMLDEMGLTTELEVDRYEEAPETDTEEREEEPIPNKDEEDIEL